MSAGTPAGTTIAVHSAGLAAGHAGLGDGRDVRQRGVALLAHGGERAQLALADVLQRRRDGADRELDAALHQVDHRLRGAAIGHVGDLDAGLALEQLAGEMRERAGAGRGVAERAGLGLGERDEILQRRRRHLRRADQHERRDADHRDRREILDRIERQAWR